MIPASGNEEAPELSLKMAECELRAALNPQIYLFFTATVYRTNNTQPLIANAMLTSSGSAVDGQKVPDFLPPSHTAL
jgi:hypothetical protein